MDRRDFWLQDPELKAAYEALGPKFRQEVEKAQRRGDPRPSPAAPPHLANTTRSAAQPARPHAPSSTRLRAAHADALQGLARR